MLSEQVELLNVRAQMHGVLQSIAVEEGQEIAKGTTLARVADQNSLKAELRIQESQARDIQLGQTVEIDTHIFYNKSKKFKIYKGKDLHLFCNSIILSYNKWSRQNTSLDNSFK